MSTIRASVTTMALLWSAGITAFFVALIFFGTTLDDGRARARFLFRQAVTVPPDRSAAVEVGRIEVENPGRFHEIILLKEIRAWIDDRPAPLLLQNPRGDEEYAQPLELEVAAGDRHTILITVSAGMLAEHGGTLKLYEACPTDTDAADSCSTSPIGSVRIP